MGERTKSDDYESGWRALLTIMTFHCISRMTKFKEEKEKFDKFLMRAILSFYDIFVRFRIVKETTKDIAGKRTITLLARLHLYSNMS